MPMSTYLRQRMSRQVLRGEPWTPPADVYTALFSGDPTPDATGPEGAVARQVSDWTEPTAEGTLTGPLVFPDSPAITYTHVGQFDAPTAGNMLTYGALTTPKTIAAGDAATLAPDEYTVTFT